VSIESITRDSHAKVSESVRIESEGVDRLRVFTPFMLQDGDHLVILLRRENGRWVLTDEGHTLMHLTYDLDEEDFPRGTRSKIIDAASPLSPSTTATGDSSCPFRRTVPLGRRPRA
jgi:hypothetical protein